MTAFDPPVTLQLAPGACFAPRGRAVRLTVIAGRLWLTRHGDLRDHFIDAGEHCVLRRSSGALVSAEGPTRMRVEPLRRSLFRRLHERLTLRRRERTARATAGGIIDRCPTAATS